MESKTLLARMKVEIKGMQSPPPGITCWTENPSSIKTFEAQISGPSDTPYHSGHFSLSISIPNNYPFHPPSMKFITPIYHPNIDEKGRICLSILKMSSSSNNAGWTPACNIIQLLLAIQSLLESPNPDDPLRMDVAQQFKSDHPAFLKSAKAFTRKHAMKDDKLKKRKFNDS